MSRCKECDFEEDKCLRHRKCHCTCEKERENYQQLVKDCICAEWTVPAGETQTIFNVSGFRQFFVSGFVSYDFGDSDFIIVRFFLGAEQIGYPIDVFKESSFAFSFTRFDRITVECSLNNPANVCKGEICINSRYPV